jgi:hypothetical protein
MRPIHPRAARAVPELRSGTHPPNSALRQLAPQHIIEAQQLTNHNLDLSF